MGNSDTFTNWSQSIVVTPHRHTTPRSIVEVVEVVNRARAEKRKVRGYGSGWSFSDIMATDDYLVNTQQLEGVVRLSQGRHGWNRSSPLPYDPAVSLAPFGEARILPDGLRDSVVASDRKFVWVGAGTKIKAIYQALDAPAGDLRSTGVPARSRWALPTMGGASGQTLAGVISTGTHGGDFDLPPIADMVRAIQFVGPDGGLYWVERSGEHAITDKSKMLAGLVDVPAANLRYDDDWFFSLLVSLGALGIICSYVIEAVDQFGLSERRFETSWNRIKRFLESGEIFTTTKYEAGRPPWIEAHPSDARRVPQGLSLFINPYRMSYEPGHDDFDDRRVMLVTHARSPSVGAKHERPAGACDLVSAIHQGAMIRDFEHASEPAHLAKIIDNLLDSLREPEGTRGYPVSYSVLDTTSSDDRPPVLSIEVAVSTVGNRHIAYLEQVFRIFDDTMDELRRRYGVARFAGGLNVRFTRPTSAYLGMQYPLSRSAQERYCHIEIIVLREQWETGRPVWGVGSDYTRNEMENHTEVWTDRFERATASFGARLHWGQLSRTGQHDPHRYPEFDKWLAVRSELTDDGSIHTFDNAFVMRNIPTWQKVPGGGRDIAIGGVGPVNPFVASARSLASAAAVEYVIGTDTPAPGNGGIWKHDGARWHKIPGYGSRIAVDPSGDWWIVNASGAIWGPGGRKPGSARDIAIGADGTVFIIAADEPAPGNGSIQRWDGREWRSVGGYGTRIAVDPRGQWWIVNSRNDIWGPGGRKPGRARDIGIGADGTVWIIGTDSPAPNNGGIYRWLGDRWSRVEGYGSAIAVAPDGKPWVVRANGEIWRLVY